MNATVTLTISDALCASILCTALEGGTGYWAVVDDVQRTPPDANGDWEYLSAVFEDTENEGDPENADFQPTRVDYALIRTGIARLLAGNVEHKGCWPNAGMVADVHRAVTEDDGCNIDADAADAIVQVGLFNELMFG